MNAKKESEWAWPEQGQVLQPLIEQITGQSSKPSTSGIRSPYASRPLTGFGSEKQDDLADAFTIMMRRADMLKKTRPIGRVNISVKHFYDHCTVSMKDFVPRGWHRIIG